MAIDANLIGKATRNIINKEERRNQVGSAKREWTMEKRGEGDGEMSLIFNMFKYANPLKRARQNWENEKGQK